jgi:hypothetical protein
MLEVRESPANGNVTSEGTLDSPVVGDGIVGSGLACDAAKRIIRE